MHLIPMYFSYEIVKYFKKKIFLVLPSTLAMGVTIVMITTSICVFLCCLSTTGVINDSFQLIYYQSKMCTKNYFQNNISIYKIKVLSVHWSKSRHILVAHVSNKVMNENTLNKIPVCMSVCLFVSVGPAKSCSRFT